MAGARKKPAKKKMVRGPKQATMRQAPAGTSAEYRRRSAALAKKHGWNAAERKRWESLQERTDRERHDLSRHRKTSARAEATQNRPASTSVQKKLRDEDAAFLRGRARRQRNLWRTGDDPRESIYDSEKRAVGRKVSPTETIRREALARQQKEAAKKKATRAKKVASAKKAAPKRSTAKKRAAPLKSRSYR